MHITIEIYILFIQNLNKCCLRNTTFFEIITEFSLGNISYLYFLGAVSASDGLYSQIMFL